MNIGKKVSRTAQWTTMVAILGMAVGPAVESVLAQTQPGTAPACPTASTADWDGDGFADNLECTGFALTGTSSRASTCTSPDQVNCLRPGQKTLFSIYARLTTGSLLSGVPTPYQPKTVYGVTFNGMSELGLNVVQVGPTQIRSDRRVTTVNTTTVQKAVRVSESLDTSSTILGNCQWGTPNGTDGCVVYSKRALNFISNTCAGKPVLQPNGTQSTVQAVFDAYMNYLVLHETGHSAGGLARTYNSTYGGYHYMPGAGFMMEQAVTYSTKNDVTGAAKCTFFISPKWNTTLDTPGVKLK
jgi:hypothetical protein